MRSTVATGSERVLACDMTAAAAHPSVPEDPLDSRWRAEIVRRCREIPHLPPYEAALSYREVVRLEGPHVAAAIDDPTARGKYLTYLKSFTRLPPRRYFTDHNYAQKLQPALELVRGPAVSVVLDAACGNGFEAVLFALHGKQVYANDVSSARVAVASVRAALYRELLGAEFQMTVTCGNAIDLAPDLPSFDMIYVQEAISHIHPAEVFLREVARRLLSAGGKLVVCDGNSWNPVTSVRLSLHLWSQRRTLRHYVVEEVEPATGRKYVMAMERTFSAWGIRRLFRQAGLDAERVVMSGFVFPFWVRTPAAPAARMIDHWAARVPVANLFGGFYTAIGSVRDRRRAP
jgi:SAM-dependent methyltransferase